MLIPMGAMQLLILTNDWYTVFLALGIFASARVVGVRRAGGINPISALARGSSLLSQSYNKGGFFCSSS